MTDKTINEVEVKDTAEQQKTFTQDEVNNIVKKEISKLKQKFIDDETAEKLKNENNDYKTKYEQLTKSLKLKDLKETFKKNGGVEARFDDFTKLNNELLESESNEYDNKVKQIIERQPYFFESVDKEKTQEQIDKELANLPKHFPY